MEQYTNYHQVVKMTDEEKIKMYMKLSKEELAKMLIASGNALDSLLEGQKAAGEVHYHYHYHYDKEPKVFWTDTYPNVPGVQPIYTIPDVQPTYTPPTFYPSTCYSAEGLN